MSSEKALCTSCQKVVLNYTNKEFEVLKAKFANIQDLQQCQTCFQPMKVIVKLTSENCSSILMESIQVNLMLECKKDYPAQIPSIKLSNTKGLSCDSLNKLLVDLQNFAFKITGKDMIVEICNQAQNFIDQYNNPLSLYQEMTFTNDIKNVEREKKEEEERTIFEEDVRKYGNVFKQIHTACNRIELARLTIEDGLRIKEELENTNSVKPKEEGINPNFVLDPENFSSPSRIKQDFEILNHISTGAYGNILKVQHKLDQGFYAVKRVKLTKKRDQDNVVKEVKLLSNLYHKNVVRYMNSWVENNSALDLPCKSVSNSSSSSSASSTKEICEKENFISCKKDENIFPTLNIFIQMELCEKNTLDAAIYNNLWMQEDRLWRLFREIVSGLSYIHRKGIIHRDLKPENIFVAFNDQIKIGDFGFSTTILNRLPAIKEEETPDVDIESEKKYNLTGNIGSVLYIAPEVYSNNKTTVYNQKIDIYSLGVIFFQMCYKPLNTLTEKSEIISKIRKKDIILPVDFCTNSVKSKVHLLRRMLDHDSVSRPTSNDLLTSVCLPQIEKEELKKKIELIFSDSRSEEYKHLLSCCFLQQNISLAENVTYNNYRFLSLNDINFFLYDSQFIQDYIKAIITNIFERHGAMCLSTPLLEPKIKAYNLPKGSVQLMSQTGKIISLPHNLRLPFARFIILNNIDKLRRYAIEKIYKESKNYNVSHIEFHPQELYECAFDVITPVANNLQAMSELIMIISEICEEIKELRNKNFIVKINNDMILEAALMYCDIKRDKFKDIIHILCNSDKLERSEVLVYLNSLNLTDKQTMNLIKLYYTESFITKITEDLKPILKRKDEAASLAKLGLKDICELSEMIDSLGIKWPIKVAPLFASQQFCGTFFHVCIDKRKREIIAAGGCYDKLLDEYRNKLQRFSTNTKEQHGVGISISLETLMMALGKLSQDDIREKKMKNVAVCCMDKSRQNELLDILLIIDSIQFKAIHLIYNSLDDVLDYCRLYTISHALIVQNNEIELFSWDKNQFQERTISKQDVAAYLKRTNEKPALHISYDSKTNNKKGININYVTKEEQKLSRKSYDRLICTHLASFCKKFAPEIDIEVLAAENVTMTVVRSLIAFTDFDKDEIIYRKSLQVTLDKHSRYKVIIEKLGLLARKNRNKKPQPVIILYSLEDKEYMALV